MANATTNGSAPAAPAVTAAPAQPAVVPAIDVAAIVAGSAAPEKRELAFRTAGRSLPFGDFALSVGTAARTGRGVTAGEACLVLTSGTTQVGMSQAAIAIAIMEGMIERGTIQALWAAADSRK